MKNAYVSRVSMHILLFSGRALLLFFFFFFSSRRRHTRFDCDWSSDVCSSDLKRRHFSRKGSGRVAHSGLATLSGTIFNAGRDAELMTERKILFMTNVPALDRKSVV